MPRPPRKDYEGAWHHVVNRGAGRARIFSGPEDHGMFLNCVAEAAQRHGLEIHGYCLMSNHFHLLLMSRLGQLSSAMRFASGKFTRLKNAAEGSDGPIFRGRFFSNEIRGDPHLATTSRYIHLNPVSAGIAAVPEDWPWSSAAAYLGLSSRPSFLFVDFILDMFGPAERERGYQQYLREGVDMDTMRRNAELENW